VGTRKTLAKCGPKVDRRHLLLLLAPPTGCD
jgi:hypothetical protein